MNTRTPAALLAMLAVTGLSAPANADVRLDDYRTIKAAGGERWASMKLYITGVGRGYQYANVELWRRHKSPLFCQPEEFAVLPENFVEILDKALAKRTLKDDQLIEYALLAGLMEAFPCDPKR
jgi:hypothetical protein